MNDGTGVDVFRFRLDSYRHVRDHHRKEGDPEWAYEFLTTTYWALVQTDEVRLHNALREVQDHAEEWIKHIAARRMEGAL